MTSLYERDRVSLVATTEAPGEHDHQTVSASRHLSSSKLMLPAETSTTTPKTEKTGGKEGTRLAALSTARSVASRPDVIAFTLAALLPLGLFTAVGVEVAGRAPSGWDADTVRFVERHYHESVAERLNLILHVSIGLGAAISIAAVLVLLANARLLDALFWALAVGGVLALDLPLKEVFRRPSIGDSGDGYSFPSGNAMASVAIVAAAVLTLPHRWRRSALVVGSPLVAGYGVLLVVQSWHYPSDVVAGWCFALAWTTVLWLALRRATRMS